MANHKKPYTPLMTVVPLDSSLQFGNRLAGASPYYNVLCKLKELGPSHMVKVETNHTNCLTTIKKRAKALGMDVLVARDGDNIYIKYDKAISPTKAESPTPPTPVRSAPTPKPQLREDPLVRKDNPIRLAAIRALHTCPMSTITMKAWLRSNANISITTEVLDNYLLALSRDGMAELGKDSKWKSMSK